MQIVCTFKSPLELLAPLMKMSIHLYIERINETLSSNIHVFFVAGVQIFSIKP